jgi:hypothetical protein
MDDSNKPPLLIADEDRDLPSGPIIFPKDPTPAPAAPQVTEAPVPLSEADAPADIPVAATIPKVTPAAEVDQPESFTEKLKDFKVSGITWFKEHKFVGGILILVTFGAVLYFWPLISCALIAQHMLKNTKGTANKTRMYQIVGALFLLAFSIQAIWIVQLAQATSIPH